MVDGGSIAQADFLARCEQSGYLMLLVPSSYLGRIYRPHIASGLARRLPDVRLVAVDDVLFREGTTVDGFDEVIPTAHLSDPRHAGRPAVNCAYSLSAWLTLDRLSSAAKCATLDLPELLYLLDIPLVYQTGALTRELAVKYHTEFVPL
ncbi:FkbM family methyltransferase, partial [Pseudomonas aeruginosa]